MWSVRAEEIVSRLIAGLTPEQLDPSRTHCVRLRALRLGWDLWSEWYLRPNGEVVVVGEDDDQPDLDVVHTDRQTVLMALAWGAKRNPALEELLPIRHAIDVIARVEVGCGCVHRKLVEKRDLILEFGCQKFDDLRETHRFSSPFRLIRVIS